MSGFVSCLHPSGVVTSVITIPIGTVGLRTFHAHISLTLRACESREACALTHLRISMDKTLYSTIG